MRTDRSAFWLYWGSMATSSFGTAVTLVAFPLLALQKLDTSAFEVSLLTAAGDIGWLLLGLPAGVIVQRVEIRFIQVGMDLFRAVALSSVPIAWWLGVLTYWQLLVVATVIGLASVLFDVANATYLPKIVDRETLVARNSWISGTYGVTSTGGPSIGGVIVQALGAIVAVLFDAITYLVSACLLRALPKSREVAPEQPPPARVVIVTGLSWLRRHPVMFPCVLWAAASNMISGAVTALTPIYLIRVLGASPAVVGIVLAMEGVGALAGAAVAPWLSARLGTARVLIVVSIISAASLFLLPLAGSKALIPLFAVGVVCSGAGIIVGSIVTRTHRQTDSPDDLLPMVMAGVRFFTWGVIPVGAVAAGAVASSPIGVHGALWSTCVAFVAAPLFLLFSPVRSRRNLSDEPELVAAER